MTTHKTAPAGVITSGQGLDRTPSTPGSTTVTMTVPTTANTLTSAGAPLHAITRIESEIVKAIADAPNPEAALIEIMDIVADERHGLALAQSAHLPGCGGHDTGDYETCEGPVSALTVPDGLDVREGQLLEARLVRLHDPQHPEDMVSIMSAGNGTLLNQAAAERFADQLIGFAAQVQGLARHATEARA